ncbi:MAG: glycosyltransferase family 2 protein [Actinobacteria bacterium]|nr:glycosyltransferase family 2 protein [Actinomycetota bacterium]
MKDKIIKYLQHNNMKNIGVSNTGTCSKNNPKKGIDNCIAILIPAYNEEKHIGGVIRSCLEHGMDIIIVDDGSTDNTAGTVNSIMPDNSNVKIILVKHERNSGKGQALITGFNYAVTHGYKGVITLDADGQHDPEEIKIFLENIERRAPDVIIGNRLGDTGKMPFIRLATNVFTSWVISRIAGKRISDVQSGFRYFNKEVLHKIKLETKNFDTEPEIILKACWLNFDIINIPISTIYHRDFVSHVDPVKDTIKFFKLIFRSLAWKKKILKNGKSR